MRIDGAEVVIRGKLIKVAQLKDEWEYNIDDPEGFIKKLKSEGTKADIFSFVQRIPDVKPKYDYPMEWDNAAAIPVVSFEHWWSKQVEKSGRNRVRNAEKKGVEVRISEFDDNLIKGIVEIYNETPIRQGRQFAHYGKNYDTVKHEESDRLDKSEFLVAYYKSEIIGFIKMIYTPHFVKASGDIAKVEHRDKSPMNALFAKAVSICVDKNIPYLVYGKYEYGKKGEDTLSSFKKQNGFIKIEYPRYYVPLTVTGKVGLKLNIHSGIKQALPEGLVKRLLDLRKKWYSRNTH